MEQPVPLWGDSFQLSVLHCAVFGTLLRDVPGVFSPEWFGGLERNSRAPRVRLAKVIEDFYKREQAAPGLLVEELIRKAEPSMHPTEFKLLQEEFELVKSITVSAPEGVNTEVRGWARLQAYKRATVEIAGILDGGGEGFDRQCDDLMEKARLVGSPGPAPIPLLASGFERMKEWERGYDYKQRIPTGLGPLDAVLEGGILKKEVFYFLAPPKGGKSTFLLHVALAASRARKGVLFCSFEMPEKAMARRADRRLALATAAELHAVPTRLSKAVSGYLAAGAGEVWLWAGVAQENGVRDAEAQINSLRRQGHAIDLVVMDYLNFMVPGRGREEELRHRLSSVSIEMSNFAKKYDVGVWSATLVNRAGVSKKIITKKDIAEAFSVVAIANGMVAICGPKILVDNGLRSLYLAAVRESEDEKVVGLYRFDGAKMRVAATDEPWPEEDGDEQDSNDMGGSV